MSVVLPALIVGLIYRAIILLKGESLSSPQYQSTKLNGLHFNGAINCETNDNTGSPKTYYNTQHNSYNFTHGHTANIYILGYGDPHSPAANSVGDNDAPVNTYCANSSIHVTGVSSGSHNHKFTPSGTISSSDIETRPDNYAVKIWERIA